MKLYPPMGYLPYNNATRLGRNDFPKELRKLQDKLHSQRGIRGFQLIAPSQKFTSFAMTKT